MGQNEELLEELARLMQSDADAAALRKHLAGVIGSPAFTSSRRSGLFLQYVVEKAIAQDIDSLKERTIGIEVFHRPPDYDTGEDAIVRVTASDVRKRLAQHYSTDHRGSEFRISLPPGGYAPEICRFSGEQTIEPEILDTAVKIQFPEVSTSYPAPRPSRNLAPFLIWLLVIAGFLLAGGFFLRAKTQASTTSNTPWRLMFSDQKPLYVVLSDPDLNEIQLLTKKSVSLSDYANGNLGCESLSEEASAICKTSLSGDKVAAVDAEAIAKTAALAANFHGSIDPHAARALRLTDIEADRNILFVGSARANPWVDLFHDKMDFVVVHDPASNLQIVRNHHPKPGESETYLPTAGPHGTGENYAVISFLHNLNNTGYVMLIAGATHEGTDAAIAIATDANRLGMLLAACGVPPLKPHQVLLRLGMMAGSPLETKAVACHALQN